MEILSDKFKENVTSSARELWRVFWTSGAQNVFVGGSGDLEIPINACAKVLFILLNQRGQRIF